MSAPQSEEKRILPASKSKGWATAVIYWRWRVIRWWVLFGVDLFQPGRSGASVSTREHKSPLAVLLGPPTLFFIFEQRTVIRPHSAAAFAAVLIYAASFSSSVCDAWAVFSMCVQERWHKKSRSRALKRPNIIKTKCKWSAIPHSWDRRVFQTGCSEALWPRSDCRPKSDY